MLIAFLHVVAEGDRIAQLILEKIHTPDIVEVNVGHLSLDMQCEMLNSMMRRISTKLSGGHKDLGLREAMHSYHRN
jgi:hypothetical protein